MWSVSFAPMVPLPLLIGLAVLAALAAGAAIVLAGRSAILRALALAVLTAALADPSLVFEDRERDDERAADAERDQQPGRNERREGEGIGVHDAGWGMWLGPLPCPPPYLTEVGNSRLRARGRGDG